MTSEFTIETHDDYHDIVPKKGWRAIELGCWLPKNNWYCEYFALYYKGNRPSVTKVLEEVSKLVCFGENNVNGIDVSLTPELLEVEIALRLKKANAL